MMRNRFLTERDEARKKRDDLKAELKASKSLARDIQEKLAEVEKALMRAREQPDEDRRLLLAIKTAIGG